MKQRNIYDNNNQCNDFKIYNNKYININIYNKMNLYKININNIIINTKRSSMNCI